MRCFNNNPDAVLSGERSLLHSSLRFYPGRLFPAGN